MKINCLRFSVFPIIVLLAMNVFLELSVYDIAAGIDSDPDYWERFNVRSSSTTALASSRHKITSFFFVATIYYPMTIVAAWVLLVRHVNKMFASCLMATAFLVATVWTFVALHMAPPGSYHILFSLTEHLALSHYAVEFRSFSSTLIRFHFWLGLFTFLCLLFCGSAILDGVKSGGLISDADKARKALDLRRLLLISAAFLTYITIYIGEWIYWPALFLEAMPEGDASLGTGYSEEMQDFAFGIRAFFGSAYSLILVAFAIPAAVALGGAHGSKDVDQEILGGAAKVLSNDDLRTLAQIVAPAVVPLATSLLGL